MWTIRASNPANRLGKCAIYDSSLPARLVISAVILTPKAAVELNAEQKRVAGSSTGFAPEGHLQQLASGRASGSRAAIP
jgi:hypothetical protein